MTDAPAFLTLANLSDEEEQARQLMVGQLSRTLPANLRQEAYYEGASRVRDLGISIPPSLKDVEAVAGWPEIVVDVVDERMDWHGWVSTNGTDSGLDQLYRANNLAVKSHLTCLDALIHGVSFYSAGTGDIGEPDVLVTPESPFRTTGLWNDRTYRLDSALTLLTNRRGRIDGWQIYFPDQTVTVERQNGRMVVTDRDQHQYGRVPVVMLRNRARSNRPYGRSEITKSVRSLTNSGMRTLLGAEVSREFYAAPQRVFLGADESMFVGPDGERRSQWDAVMGRVLAVPRDDNGELPATSQWDANSPAPFTQLLQTYAQMISATSGVPATHLGFSTDNPASADAIRESNSRLDKRAIRRQAEFDLGLIELGAVMLLWATGELPEAGSLETLWGDPATPTPAASADRAVKLVSAGILPADSDVTAEQVGLSPSDIIRVAADRRRALAQATRAALLARQTPAPPADPNAPPTGQPAIAPPVPGQLPAAPANS